MPPGRWGDRSAGTQRGDGGAEGPGTALGVGEGRAARTDQTGPAALRPIQFADEQSAGPVGVVIPEIPHAAGTCNLLATKTAAAIAANIQRLADKEPLEWLVNPA